MLLTLQAVELWLMSTPDEIRWDFLKVRVMENYKASEH